MPESQAFAIATQQSHALGKSPKGYGTARGKREAKAKYESPSDDTKAADPGGIGKEAAGPGAVFQQTAQSFMTPLIEDTTRKIVREEMARSFAPIEPLPRPPKHKKSPPKVKTASILGLVDGFSNELEKISRRDFLTSRMGSFYDELEKIANFTRSAGMPATPSAVKSLPHRTPGPAAQINESRLSSPVQAHQPVLGPPPVRG